MIFIKLVFGSILMMLLTLIVMILGKVTMVFVQDPRLAIDAVVVVAVVGSGVYGLGHGMVKIIQDKTKDMDGDYD